MSGRLETMGGIGTATNAGSATHFDEIDRAGRLRLASEHKARSAMRTLRPAASFG